MPIDKIQICSFFQVEEIKGGRVNHVENFGNKAERKILKACLTMLSQSMHEYLFLGSMAWPQPRISSFCRFSCGFR
jgi:hypothetical protein